MKSAGGDERPLAATDLSRKALPTIQWIRMSVFYFIWNFEPSNWLASTAIDLGQMTRMHLQGNWMFQVNSQNPCVDAQSHLVLESCHTSFDISSQSVFDVSIVRLDSNRSCWRRRILFLRSPALPWIKKSSFILAKSTLMFPNFGGRQHPLKKPIHFGKLS